MQLLRRVRPLVPQLAVIARLTHLVLGWKELILPHVKHLGLEAA